MTMKMELPHFSYFIPFSMSSVMNANMMAGTRHTSAL